MPMPDNTKNTDAKKLNPGSYLFTVPKQTGKIGPSFFKIEVKLFECVHANRGRIPDGWNSL